MAETYVSISQFSKYVKGIFDAEIMLHHIFLYGEVSSYNVSNNIAYFTLKDEEALLSCVMFGANQFDRPNIGDMVLVQGSPNYYIKGGKFSFQVTSIEPYGKGKLYEEFLKLKEKLQQLGYFDEDKKQAIPDSVRRIGVVTSKEGAVIQDIINVTTRRNPMIDIVLYPVKVQGIGAEQEIAEGINYFSNYGGVDCVVVARGGGSAEDLQAYNTETVAHAVHNCTLPVVSAVGHETDFTICDFCSDLRVPTPSAAAEVLAWDWYAKQEMVESNYHWMVQKVEQTIYSIETKLDGYKKHLVTSLQYPIELQWQNVNQIWDKMVSNLEKNIAKKEYIYDKTITSFLTKDPQAMLQKGYVKLEKQGKIVKSKKDLQAKDIVQVVLLDGKVDLEVK